jgi:hypothetical protein
MVQILCIELTEIKPGVTHLESFFHMNLNGQVPTLFTHRILPGYVIGGVKDTIMYFQHLLPLAETTEIGGRDMGDMLMDRVLEAQSSVGWKHKVSEAGKEVDDFFSRNSALREVQAAHPCFRVIVKTIVEQRIYPPGVIKTKLAELTFVEATKIGSFLKGEITVGLNSDAATDNWISSQVALVELDAEYKFFRPFVYAIALRIIKSSDWGMKIRVIVGAGLSIFDMSSDIYMIYLFSSTDERGFAIATLTMIVINMFIQIVMVLSASAKVKTSTRVKEVLYCVFCVKAGVDAYRIATDWQPEHESAIDPMQEMIFAKAIETAAEALPGSAVQIFALLKGATRSRAAIASIVISVATTSFTASIMTFDYDLAPKKRTANPEFYGFIPSDKRIQTLTLMLACTFCHVTSRVFACALVAAVNKKVLVAYLGLDVALMVAFKVLRGDFVYAALKTNAVGVVVSLLHRTVSKILVDFTGFFQGRHPYEQGGIYWVWCTVTNPLLALAAAWFYNSNSGDLGDSKLSAGFVWFAVAGNGLIWLCLFVTLMRSMDQDYLHTFFSGATARDFTIATFRNADTDEKKALIFKRNFHVWRSIEGEVRAWVHANFAKWQRERPDWYTQKLINKIPEEVLSKEEMVMLVSGGNKTKRRRSSLMAEVKLLVE